MIKRDLGKMAADFAEGLAAKVDAIEIDDEAIGRMELERTQKNEEARIRTTLAQFPPRFANASFDNYRLSDDPNVRERQRRLIDHLKSGASVVMFGTNGTGKTHLAFASIRNQVMQGKTTRYMTASEFFDSIRLSFGTDSDTTGAIRRYQGTDYLVIDEVDKSYGSPTEFITLSRLVDYRYMYLKATVLIANADKDKDSDKYVVDICGRSVYERLVEGDGYAFFMDWPSYRKKRNRTV